MSNLSYQVYRVLWKCVDWVYPPRCAGCGNVGDRWCKSCHSGTDVIGDQVCEICGRRLESRYICDACRAQSSLFTAARSWAVYTGSIRKAIHRLKYSGDMSLGEILSIPMVDLLGELGWLVDLVTPVPISRERHEARGYNQAALLAYPLSLSTGYPYSGGALIKVREVPSQVGLGYSQRYDNVAQAYQANGQIVSGKAVLVIDDLITSGATLNACSAALRANGAREVYGLSLARAGMHQHV